jgi:hypothetical protein
MTMPFRLLAKAHKWFRDVHGFFEAEKAPMFDEYYLCLMMGLAARKFRSDPGSDTHELPDNFPGEYSTRGRVIVSLFLRRELERCGIDLTERKALHKEISDLVNSSSLSGLSEEGMKQMNAYAHGGYEVLADLFGEENRPRHIETFLPLYKAKLEELLAEGADEAASDSAQLTK